MSDRKKKFTGETNEPEEEDITIDFDWIFLIGRTRFMLDQRSLEYMTFGQWRDIYQSYKQLYNFETKKLLYKDVEDEIKRYREEHQEVASLLSL